MKTETQGSETMGTETGETETPKRGLITGTAMLIVGLAAVVTSWSGWTGLAELCGINGTWKPSPSLPTLHVSWLVAVCVDMYALVGFQMWLHKSPRVSDHSRNFARGSTLVAIFLGAAANVAYHVISIKQGAHSGQPKAPVPITVVVSSLAPIFLGLVAHMDALFRRDMARARQGETVPTQTMKTETRVGRLAGLALSRLEQSLIKEAETAKTETQTPAAVKIQPSQSPVLVQIETPETQASEAKIAKPRTATVSSLADRSDLTAKRLAMIKAAEPDWMTNIPSKKRVGEIINNKGSQTQQNLREALMAERDAAQAIPQTSVTVTEEAPSDARELVGVG